eukprot:TRINITY_DN3973_c0_g1_i2.p1 TRINITY_DN3973_c0_g1~~TRINITY_DN3973_c0_g1_i2.p1  ORF type:complete len:708 (-),score=159.26 TRINITY_DN3973_c0_g1_i2:574-2697(-)
MLKNLMEEKQLNFNAPLLSVRRFASTAGSNIEDNRRVEKFQPKRPPLGSYKPELKSGPVRHPGAVPFEWEQIPGRPKDGHGQHPRNAKLPPLVPKLPPGRIVDVKQPSSAKSVEDGNSKALTLFKPPQNDNLTHRSLVVSSSGNATPLERPKGDAKEEHSANVDDYNDDDAFSDALDTMSRTESFFMNCSVSGFSGFDGPSRSASMDAHARDFMMDRFLPAATAMASEAPQYASRRQLVAREPVRKVNIVDQDRRPRPFGGNKQPMRYQSRPYKVPHVQDVEEEDSDDDDEDCDDTGNLMAKACGILPRFCLKNSFCLLNPVPGMKIQSRMPLSSVRRKVPTHIKTTGSEQLSEPDPEQTWEAVYKHKLLCGLEPPGTYDNGSKPTSESNQLTLWSDSQTPEGSSPFRHSTGDGISPYRNEAPQSLFHEGIGFLGVPKQGNNRRTDGLVTYGNRRNDDQGMLSCQSRKRGSGSSSPAIEKTLYVDSVCMLESSNSCSSSSDMKELMSSAEKDSELLVESERLDKRLTLEACLREDNQVKNLNERDLLPPKMPNTAKSNLLSFSEDSIVGASLYSREGSKDKDGFVPEAKSLECSKVLINSSPGSDMPEPLDVDEGDSYTSFLQSPLPPPLPKSPSESWLCRTLPSVSSMDSSSRSYLGVQFRSRKQLLKASPVDPKWETIVKTNNAQQRHLRFSEELKIHSHHASEA